MCVHRSVSQILRLGTGHWKSTLPPITWSPYQAFPVLKVAEKEAMTEYLWGPQHAWCSKLAVTFNLPKDLFPHLRQRK